jgi:TonB-dependent receptor
LQLKTCLLKMKNFLTFLLLFVVTGIAQAQNGVITGVVQSSDGRNLPSVTVKAKGTEFQTETNLEGRYRLELPAGNYTVVFSLKDHEEESYSVESKAGEEIYQNVLMTASQTMEGVRIRVKSKPQPATAAGAIQTKRITPQMVEVLSMEDMKKVNIRTTADALKRIPGATIMEGKFANIRGMYDRYNAGYLNGAPLPSTESDRKAFSFDVIPANMIDNIMVIKSGTPDLMGDFGGGIIRINTRNIPVKLTQNLSLGFQYNSITTLRDIESFSTQTSEFFGMTGSKRQIPAIDGDLYSTTNPTRNAAESSKFNHDWKINRISPMPGPRFNYTIGVPFKLSRGRKLGLIASVNYSLTNRYSDGVVNRNDLGDNRQLSTFNDRLYNFNVQNGGLFNASFEFSKRSRIDWKNLYNLNYDAASTLRTGVADVDNGLNAEAYANQVNANRLYSTQLNGTHTVANNKGNLSWMLNYGSTRRRIPDYRIATYGLIDGERYLILNDFFNAGSGRFFSDLTEQTLSGGVDYQHTFNTGKLVTNAKTGVFVQQRERDFASREFVYGPVGKTVKTRNTPEVDLAADKIRNDGIYFVEKTRRDKDAYDGISSLSAAYLMLEHNYPLFSVNKKPYMLRLIYGARIEQFEQKLSNDYFRNVLKMPLAEPGLQTDILPSVNVQLPITDRSSFRLSYFKSLNRPEMRELAPFSFYNFNINSEFAGTTTLKRAQIHNFDARYEIYPGGENMVSVGVFRKEIINPIEFSLNVTQPAIRSFNYENAPRANVVGLEIEARRKLDFLSGLLLPGVFNNTVVYGNLALIDSRVNITGLDGNAYNRQLQGQSPFVANISVFYEDPKTGWVFNTSFNKLGSRIAYIGVPESVQRFGGDIFEYGRGVWDIQIGKNFKKQGTVRCTFGDVLAQNAVFYQDLNKNNRYDKNGDNTLFSFTYGRTVSVSYSFNF